MEKDQTTITQIDGWTFRIKEPNPASKEAKILLLLHGHLGNENAMWILTNPLPKGLTLIAPRAPKQLGENQYSWHDISPKWPEIEHYQDLTKQLLERVDTWVKNHSSGALQYDLMGFSQGAVVAYALGILHPDRVNRIAAIAGFIPRKWKPQLSSANLKNKPFFIAHGTQDDTIPIEKARQAALWLREIGADVEFCTAETGHKISANCFNGLGEFFK